MPDPGEVLEGLPKEALPRFKGKGGSSWEWAGHSGQREVQPRERPQLTRGAPGAGPGGSSPKAAGGGSQAWGAGEVQRGG